ncbi:MAG: rhomboid family intramembrane serine protease [Akkermansiaceae bacterium]|nr:rhomboid family intramembrane serine protease [Armatimonadota bacterium]
MIPLRDENPVRITPWLTYLLIVVNVIVFLMEEFGGIGATERGLVGPMAGWTMIPAEITTGQDIPTNGVSLRPFYLTLFTSMFMHGGWLHLGGNMLYLWIFGNNIEDTLGRGRYLFFYLLSGLAASAAQIAIGPDSVIPNLGASGAIAGVLGAYLILFPTARVDSLIFLAIFFTKIRVPAFILLGFWIVSQFFSQFLGSLTMRDGGSGGVAYMAHIGGFIAGMVLIKLFGAKPPRRNEYGAYDAGNDYRTGANYRN